MSPAISVIIPVYNEAGRIGPTIEAIRSSTDLPLEVIVVDDGSIDHGCDELATGRHVRLYRQPHTGAAAARHAGALRAAAPLLVFVDAHTTPEPGWLETMLPAADDRNIVTAAIGTEEGTAYGYGTTITSPKFEYVWLPPPADGANPTYPVPGAGSGCMLVHKAWYDYLGGFDTMRGLGVEDIELCVRCWGAGGTVQVASGARIRHYFKAGDEPGRETSGTFYLYNVMRAAILHHNDPDRDRVFRLLATCTDQYNEATALLRTSDIRQKYRQFRRIKRRDLGWLCRRFQIDLKAGDQT
jgi:glycosyltransferase involved in cell wall biosynthesis